MFCQKCGFQNEDSANFCLKCGADLTVNQNAAVGSQQPDPQPQQQYNQPQQPNGYPYPQNTGNPYAYQPGYPNPNYLPPVNSHLALSIVSIFFNFILGIIAIVFSNKSKNCYNMGDYNGAMSNAKTAKILAIIGIVVGGIFSLFYIVGIFAALPQMYT